MFSKEEDLNQVRENNIKRRKVIGLSLLALPVAWKTPIVKSVVLPAHAQTSICVADTQAGGPLSGNPYGATNCQDACAGEAANIGGELCSVSESGSTTNPDCLCQIDTGRSKQNLSGANYGRKAIKSVEGWSKLID